MSWTTPKTDWTPADRCTAADMIRICGNVNYVAGTALKTAWTSNDMVDAATWNGIINTVSMLVTALGLLVSVPNSNMDSTNFNRIEGDLLSINERLEMIKRNEPAHAGMGYITGDALYV